MKTKLLSVLLGIAVSGTVLANKHEAAHTDAKMAEMMKMMQKYSTPGAPHKVLSDMVGEWTYTSKMWHEVGGKPVSSSGTSSMRMILGGRWLQHDTKGEGMMGVPFEGMGLMGYDNVKSEYSTLWLDNMSTGVVVGKGSFDAKKKILKDSGEFSCPMTEDKDQDYRGEWQMVGKKKMIYSMYGKSMGKTEFKMMEMTFSRVK